MIPTWIRDVVAKAMTFRDRVALYREHPDWFGDCPEVDARLAFWQSQVAGGDPIRLDQRLQREGWDRTSIRPILGQLTFPTDAPLPSWSSVLVELARSFEQPAAALDQIDGQVPFEPYWLLWIAVGVGSLRADPRVGWQRLGSRPAHDFSRSLLLDLARTGTPCLLQAFNLFRYSRMQPNEMFLGLLGASRPTTHFDAFMLSLRQERAQDFLVQYAALARLAAIRVQHWVQATSELLKRIEHDAPLLEQTFGHAFDVSSIEQVQTDLSDPHNGGRRVAIVQSADGGRVVYKPRSLEPEASFQSLLSWVDPRTVHPRVVVRDGYGWMEVVTARSCRSESELDRYFENSGALLATIQLLGGSDMHFENLIACGDQPVLVDLEALVPPLATEPIGTTDAFLLQFEQSVLRTGLLPQWGVTPFGDVLDTSGLGATQVDEANRAPQFVHANTDFMTVKQASRVSPQVALNQPQLVDGTAATIDHHPSALLGVFQATYRKLMNARERLLAVDGPLAPFQRGWFRLVARDTDTYLTMLREGRKADRMTDGLTHSLFLDRLTAASAAGQIPLSAAESGALDREDIPHFMVRSDCVDLFALDLGTRQPERVFEGAFCASGFASLENNVRRMGEEDLALQTRLVELSLESRWAVGLQDATAQQGLCAAEVDLDKDEARLAALDIARDLVQSAFVRGNAEYRVQLEPNPATGRPGVAVMGPWLYRGGLGVALALASAYSVSQEQPLRDSALRTLRPLREGLAAGQQAFDSAPLGAFEGVGGLVYALFQIGKLLDEPSLEREALQLACSIEAGRIDSDKALDVVEGSAGLLLCLCPLYDATGSSGLLTLIDACASHLLRTACACSVGVGWATASTTVPLCGMAHGGSGVAMALAEAFRRTSNLDYWQACMAALAYERSQRSDEHRNWPDLRDSGSEQRATFMTAWCHGAPGIALARSRILQVRDHPLAREDLEMAIETTKTALVRAPHLCCGLAGVDDIVFEVGRRLGDRMLVQEAERRRMGALVRAREQGWLGRRSLSKQTRAQGFMQGLAGLAYGLLRAAGAENLPCVLDLSG